MNIFSQITFQYFHFAFFCRYECRECSKMFASATALANHRKTHERRDTNVKCSLCIQTFSSVAKMQEHFLLAHTVDETESSPGKIKSRGYCCPHCKQQFASVESVQAHVKTHRTGKWELTEALSKKVCSFTFMILFYFLTLFVKCKPVMLYLLISLWWGWHRAVSFR